MSRDFIANFLQGTEPSGSDILPLYSFPCPGLTADDNPKIIYYLHRTGVLGGGAPSRDSISRRLLWKPYKKLTNRWKKKVQSIESNEYQWRNDHYNERIISSNCQKSTRARSFTLVKPCKSCQALFDLKVFHTAISRQAPARKNVKFTPIVYRPTALGHIYARTKGIEELIEAPVSTNRNCVELSQYTYYESRVAHLALSMQSE
jgi:hypothetical protein